MSIPTYALERCSAAYQLNWSLAIYWKHIALPAEQWLTPLTDITELDGVRILVHKLSGTNVSQFLLSTKPDVAPSNIIRSVKGRLQHHICETSPASFRRNYSIHSVGSANSSAIQRYVATQIDHHKMADKRADELLREFQFCDQGVDLKQVRRSSYGEFIFNLHIVLTHQHRAADVSAEWLRQNHETLPRIAKAKGHLLSRVGVASDHLHITLGADITELPSEITLAYMNNLAHAHGSKAVFQKGFYVGTFGRYDLQAVRRRLAS